MPQFSAPSPDDATTTITTDTWGNDDGVIPPPGGFDGGYTDDTMDEERVLNLLISTHQTLPEAAGKEWLSCSDKILRPYAHEIVIYCRNHNIKIEDYIGDWMPLASIASIVYYGMYNRHIEHKKSEGTYKKKESKKQILQKTEEKAEFSDVYEPPVRKEQPRDAGTGGDSLPEESEPESEPKITKDESGLPEDAGTIDYGDVEITDETVIIGGRPV